MLLSAEDLAKHTEESDCWLAIHGKVYNVSDYLVDHPGGLDVMMEHAGARSGGALESSALIAALALTPNASTCVGGGT